MQEMYEQARSLVKAKDYAQAEHLLAKLYAQDPQYRAVAYYYGRVLFALKKNDRSAEVLAGYVRQRPTPKSNIANTYFYLAKLALRDEDADTAQKFIKRAAARGLKNERLEKIQQQIWQVAATQAEDKPVLNSRMQVRLDRLASNGNPIVMTTEKEYQSAYIFVDGLSYQQITMLGDREWHELRLTTPRWTNIPGYMSASVLESRTYYDKYLPLMSDIRYMSAFNDYLEENAYFQQKWALSKVFALLQVPEFNKAIVEQLLDESRQTDGQVLKHLAAVDDLVMLKQAGEVLPVQERQRFRSLPLMQSPEFGFIHDDESSGYLYLKQKLAAERTVRKAIAATTDRVLPFREQVVDFKPLGEQADFIQWLRHEPRRVVALLGVGGSGKTFVLGNILQTDQVVALAPTHKAKLNLVDNGFQTVGTVQSVVADTDTAQAFKSFKTVIVDEVSMMTMEMMAQLLAFFSPDTRFILIGDDAQLPPVSLDEDALSVTGDLIGMLRTFGTGFIFQNNHRARNAQLREFIAHVREGDAEYIRKTRNYHTDTYTRMLQEKMQHLELDDTMILAYTNQRVAQINEYFFNHLSAGMDDIIPFTKRGKYGRGGFFIGAKVMFYNNDQSHQFGYTTSEYGEVTNLRQSNMAGDYGEVEVTIPATGKVYKLPIWQARQDLLLAYAITIHKSQGSGARKVYVMEAADYGLAYTAVSRAKEELVFVDYDREMLIQALATPSPKKINLYR